MNVTLHTRKGHVTLDTPTQINKKSLLTCMSCICAAKFPRRSLNSSLRTSPRLSMSDLRFLRACRVLAGRNSERTLRDSIVSLSSSSLVSKILFSFLESGLFCDRLPIKEEDEFAGCFSSLLLSAIFIKHAFMNGCDLLLLIIIIITMNTLIQY